MRKFNFMVLVCAFIGMSSISLRSYAADDTCDPEPRVLNLTQIAIIFFMQNSSH